MAKRKSDEELLKLYEEKEQKILARKKALEQRINEKRDKTRTHLMCKFGGMVEEEYKKIFGENERLYINENVKIIDLIYGTVIKNLANMKNEIEVIKTAETKKEEGKEENKEIKKESQSTSAGAEVVENKTQTNGTQETTNEKEKVCEVCGARLMSGTNRREDGDVPVMACPLHYTEEWQRAKNEGHTFLLLNNK